jgi:uncharacterized protein (TIRG00374 family)
MDDRRQAPPEAEAPDLDPNAPEREDDFEDRRRPEERHEADSRDGPPDRRGATLADGLMAAADELDRPDEDEAEPEEDVTERGLAILRNKRRLASLVLAVVLMIVAIYVIFPKVVGIEDALARVDDAKWYWIVVAIGFMPLSFISYANLFKSVLGGPEDDEVRRRLDRRASYEITFAGFAATVLFSAAGAGGVALTYWALRRAGMPRRRSACRMVAFMALLYTVYLLSLVVFGVLLETDVLPGKDPLSGTIIPAAVGGSLLLLLALVALIPQDFERRMQAMEERDSRTARVVGRLAQAPAVLASGVRTAIAYIRHPGGSLGALLGALGWWTGLIGILWASFHAYGVEIPLGIVIQGYFLGMFANLLPSPAAGVGTVDAGLIGAFVIFGIPAGTVFPAILTFRLITIWLPIPVGVWGYLALRKTIQRWAEERRVGTIQSKVTAEAT